MSTSKKKVTQKPVEPKSKYNIGNTVFFMNHPGGKSEILEGKVEAIHSVKYAEKDILGKVKDYRTVYSYDVSTLRGPMEVSEYSVFPNFVEIAKEFAKGFLFLLK